MKITLGTSFLFCMATGFVAAQNYASYETGALVKLPMKLFSAPEIQREISPAPQQTQLILSDNPESVTKNGLLLREDAKPGLVRLYLYNVISGSVPKNVPVVVKNISSDTLNLQFSRCAWTEPSTNYNRVAQKVMYSLLAGLHKKCADIVIPPGGKAVLDPDLENATVSSEALTHGIYEFKIDQPARLTVLSRDINQDSLQASDTLRPLPRNEQGAGRGLFPTSNFMVGVAKYSTADGPRMLTMADGDQDKWIQGHDSLTSATATVLNEGNYGAMYTVSLPYSTPDKRAILLALTNPRSPAQYCTYMTAAMTVSSKEGFFEPYTVMLPTKTDFIAAPPQAAVIAKIPPLPEDKTSGTVVFTYSPPGAACLPSPIIIAPYKP